MFRTKAGASTSIDRYRNALAAGVALAGLLLPSTAYGQTSGEAQTESGSPLPQPVTDERLPEASGTAQPAQDPTEIVVTGSRIRGVAPVGSTVLTVGREDFTATSAVSTAEIFRDIPQVVNVGVNETNRGSQGGAGNITYGNSVNLRGIGPGATLTLVNGHRVPPAGTTGGFIDPSIIPLLALQRVEVIADGASAVYGSDAIAGVVNLILRRDVDGVEANARYGVADNYTTRQLGIAVGKQWNSGQLMLAFEHSYHSALSGLDRDYIRSDLRDRGGPDFRGTNCNPGNIVVGGVSYAIPVGGVTPATAGSLVRGTINRCERGALSDVIPEVEKNSVVATFRQDLTSNISIVGDAYYYKREYLRRAVSAAQALTVPRTNAFFVAPPGTNPASVTVQYYFGNELGPVVGFDGEAESYQGTLGLDIDLGSNWKADVSGSYGRSEDIAFNYGVNPTTLTAALASGNPATAFNPFGGPNNSAVTAAIINYVELAALGNSKALQVQAQIDGPLFELPGGAVRFAGGLEYNKLNLVSGTRSGPIAALTGTDARYRRNVKSAFAELFIPVFGADNAIPGFRELTINLAGRYDKYSDVGETWNPKIGANWRPFEGLRLRGNWGTSFRAPSLTNIVSPSPSLTVQNFVDPLSPSGFTSGYAWSDGNPDLKPEEATTWSVGADFTPPQIPGLDLSATYFNVRYEGQIASRLGDLTILQRESLFPGLIYRNPSAEFVNSLTSTLPIRGVPLTTVGVIVDARPANLGITKIDGIDFIASYRHRTDNAGTFGVGVNGIWYNNYDVAQTPTSPVLERIDFINFPVEYRLRGNVNWSHNGLRLAAFVNYVPSYKNNNLTPIQRIDSWTTVDFDLSYDIPGPSGGFVEGMTVSLNIMNLFDKDPPFAALAPSTGQSGGFDVQQSNPLGRLITVGVNLRF